MSFTGIQATINFYTIEQANLTNQLTDIMQDITSASSKTSKIATSVAEKRGWVRETYPSDSDAYDDVMDEIENEFETQMAVINSWENELATKKDLLQTQLQATTSYKESFTAALKTNVQGGFKYAQGGGQ